jgi:hypothetical protein
MNIPDVIYLQWLDEDGEEQEEVTWCIDQINNTDIPYFRWGHGLYAYGSVTWEEYAISNLERWKEAEEALAIVTKKLEQLEKE